jgi:hypothetical protein
VLNKYGVSRISKASGIFASSWEKSNLVKKELIMKTVKIITLCLVLTLAVVFFVYGCKKKEQPAETPQETTSSQESVNAVVSEKTEEIKQVVETLKADMNTSISEIKAEVEKLNTDQLKEVAMQYKELILAKTTQLETLNSKLLGMDVAQAFSDESKSLRDEFQVLEQSIKALKERFQIYYNKLKEKGGDLAGLAL